MESIADVLWKGYWWQNRGKWKASISCEKMSRLSPCFTGILQLNLCIGLVIVASTINGYDSSILNGEPRWGWPLVPTGWRGILMLRICLGLQILPKFEEHFKDPNGTTLGFMSAAQNFTALVVRDVFSLGPFHIGFKIMWLPWRSITTFATGLQFLPIAPFISDGLGRRKALSIGCFITVGGAILQTFAGNVGTFIASRCLSEFIAFLAFSRI